MITADVQRRFWNKVEKTETCWLWTGCRVDTPYGKAYGRLAIRRKAVASHRISWEIHYGKIPREISVLHKCDVPHCVRPDHLFLGTHDDNMADKTLKGRAKKKLTPALVRKIRREYRVSDISKNALAIRYDLSYSSVDELVRLKAWRFVDSESLQDFQKKRTSSHRGSAHRQAKMTEEKVRKMRQRYADGGVSYTQLARGHGISVFTVRDILVRRSWRHC